MKKKLLIALLALLSIVCLAFGLSACGESDKGTYYLFENDDYIMSEYIELDGKNWSDAHGMGGTYEIKDGTISLYMDFFGQQTLWQTGTIGNGKLTLQGFSGEMTYFKEGMAHTHSFSEWHVTVEPTCTRAGEKMRVCSCGESERLPVSALGHDTTGSSISITYATCSSVGKISSLCKRCGEQIGEEIPIKPNNHYIEDGKNTTVCSGCGIQLAESLEFQVNDNGEAILTEGEGASITIPAVYHGKPVTSIGRYAFDNCTSLTSITIPDSVTSIEQSVFSGCTSLTSITIPDSVTSIGGSAFSGCTSLLQVNFGNNSKLESIGDWAFDGCTNVTSITIPNNVTSIEQCVFSGCTNLTSVTIGNGVTSIGSFAFDGCTNLTSITIPNNVTSIGLRAFYNCTNLTSIIIPDGVTSIGSFAFDGCTSLESITVQENNTTYSSQDGILYNKAKTQFIYIPTAIKGEVTIPDSVTFIGGYAFEYCTSLESVTIGNGVTSIGWSAFQGCTSLESVTIGNGVTSIGNEAFRDCTKLTSVKFENTAGWKVSKPSDMSDAKDVTVTDDTTENAKLLKSTYYNYYWKRYNT